jgi:hypothetical protein
LLKGNPIRWGNAGFDNNAAHELVMVHALAGGCYARKRGQIISVTLAFSKVVETLIPWMQIAGLLQALSKLNRKKVVGPSRPDEIRTRQIGPGEGGDLINDGAIAMVNNNVHGTPRLYRNLAKVTATHRLYSQ